VRAVSELTTLLEAKGWHSSSRVAWTAAPPQLGDPNAAKAEEAERPGTGQQHESPRRRQPITLWDISLGALPVRVYGLAKISLGET
jgi:hypothetical protein